MQELRKIDCHVHLVGDGSSGSGCWFRLPGLWKKFLGRMMVKGVGLPTNVIKGGLDDAFTVNLVKQVKSWFSPFQQQHLKELNHVD